MKRARKLNELELQAPCLSEKDPNKKGYTVKLVQYCTCADCKRVFDAVARKAVFAFVNPGEIE